MNPKEIVKNSGISRREFMTIATTLGGLAVVNLMTRHFRKDPVFKTEFDQDKSLSFKEAAGLALFFDKVYDMMPTEEIKTSINFQEMVSWTIEVLPQFEYEGAVDRAMVPYDLGFQTFIDAMSHNHTAGRSNCDEFVTNYRFTNPNSSWYQDPYWIPTVIHELVHIQQQPKICSTADRENVENTAQIVTLEVMSGLINAHGKKNKEIKKQLTFALIDELRGLAMGSAWGIALRENRPNEYEKLRDRLSDKDPEIKARFERSKRQWEDKQVQLRWIMETYNERPLTQIVNAIQKGDNKIEGLALPKIQTLGGYYMQREFDRVFVINDLAYFIKNVKPLVKAIFNSENENPTTDTERLLA